MGFDNIKNSPSGWQYRLDNLAVRSGIHSILIMESQPDTMQVVVANDQPIYHVGDRGPKGSKARCHELYCERVSNTAQPLFIPDARIEDEWKSNEDFVKYNLGVYFGYPIVYEGVVVGSICAINDKGFDFYAGSPSVSSELQQLKVDLELALVIS